MLYAVMNIMSLMCHLQLDGSGPEGRTRHASRVCGKNIEFGMQEGSFAAKSALPIVYRLFSS